MSRRECQGRGGPCDCCGPQVGEMQPSTRREVEFTVAAIVNDWQAQGGARPGTDLVPLAKRLVDAVLDPKPRPRTEVNTPVPCFVCGKRLSEVGEEGLNQPNGATAFITNGHYGSTVFDEMDGTWLELNICDDCLSGCQSRVLHGRQYAPFGPRPTPKPVYIPWHVHDPENEDCQQAMYYENEENRRPAHE